MLQVKTDSLGYADIAHIRNGFESNYLERLYDEDHPAEPSWTAAEALFTSMVRSIMADRPNHSMQKRVFAGHHGIHERRSRDLIRRLFGADYKVVLLELR